MSEIITVKNLYKQYNYYEKEAGLKNSFKGLFTRKKLVREAVKDISFQVKEGEVVGFLGANGAGKTTTLKMLSGILYPTAGEISVMGYRPSERKKNFKRQFSIVMGQKNQLWWDLPASESLELNRCIYEIDRKDFDEMVDYLTELLEVKELLNVQVRRLSLGERMKMELIASLIYRPKVLFLDEPTIGLDIISQKNIQDFIREYNKEFKTTVILTSHYMNDIEKLCRRTIIMNHGSIVYDGELKEVNGIFGDDKLLKFQLDSDIPLDTIAQYGRIIKHENMNFTLQVGKDEVKACAVKLLQDLPVNDFNVEDIPVEEGITLLYKKEEV
ncbi:ABC-2 type transport system ATP-binding protein [Anaerocolumna jejuensis DSM 15929]|uniref:ABC-2 type transport system ATP-binding protein n=1 Tax=Anaerocolumna jejuensis DSM 15929 TaxID=1121322 RepID=A0A1M6NX85_9FIRM|nr:ATP-binding cassette domain-containing protein [Anaerocolumna jejuensis]SHK00359.1 ABC-2 type transport system ATP-binding protein [Anaerocolumna jejuensis DSM 15929]